MKKSIVLVIFLLGFVATGLSQSKKMVEKATKKVEQINNQIKSVDESLALTKEQKDTILVLLIDKMKEVKTLRKNNASKEAVKAVNKKYNQKIFKEVLTKKQMKARKKAKELVKQKK